MMTGEGEGSAVTNQPGDMTETETGETEVQQTLDYFLSDIILLSITSTLLYLELLLHNPNRIISRESGQFLGDDVSNKLPEHRRRPGQIQHFPFQLEREMLDLQPMILL